MPPLPALALWQQARGSGGSVQCAKLQASPSYGSGQHQNNLGEGGAGGVTDVGYVASSRVLPPSRVLPASDDATTNLSMWGLPGLRTVRCTH